ncbi:MAG: DUF1173 family protein [Pseudorhizobium sp.]
METPVVRRLQIEAEIVAEDAEGFIQRLTDAYHLRQRPLCLCRPSGVPMYVARIGKRLVVKRMPLTGKDHHPSCPSFEPVEDWAGLGASLWSAVNSRIESQRVAIDVNFALSKGRISTSAGAGNKRDAHKRAPKAPLSLLALLHLLWHAGGLVEWTGHWIGRRRWWHVHRHLVAACRQVSIRGEPLSQRVLIPESFKVEDKLAIETRRSRTLTRILRRGGNRRMLLIGEVKTFRGDRDGHEVIVKHLPRVRLPLDDVQHRRLQQRFATPLSLWRNEQSLHLMAIATVETAAAGALRVTEIAVMAVTEHWLPVEDAYELQLVNRLARRRSKMVKTLRFDVPRTQPIATVTLPKARPLPLALYRVPADADTDFETRLAQKIRAHPQTRAWIWRPRDGMMPPLP